MSGRGRGGRSRRGGRTNEQRGQRSMNQLPGLNNAMGKVAPHSTSEANCESLFSESGHLAKPHMNRTANETFERLVIAKHRISRIYVSLGDGRASSLEKMKTVTTCNFGSKKNLSSLKSFLNTVTFLMAWMVVMWSWWTEGGKFTLSKFFIRY